jgi:Kdo2-lipid IVA lauroyltransferase/acyltransferase
MQETLLTYALRGLGCVTSPLPDALQSAAGTVVGRVLEAADPSRRRITESNLREAFPEKKSPDIHALVRQAYANLGITLIELLALSRLSKADILRRISIPGIDVLRHRAAQGKPSVLMSGHLGNWELLALAGALLAETPFVIVVHPQHNAKADAFLNAIRTRFGNVVVPMGQAARPLVHAMSHGGTVAFLADQYADPLVNAEYSFFGRFTPTYEAPAALALRYHAAMFAAYALRQGDGHYHAVFHEIPSSDLQADKGGIAELTRRHISDLENAIRISPGQWSWQHRRWRS